LATKEARQASQGRGAWLLVWVSSGLLSFAVAADAIWLMPVDDRRERKEPKVFNRRFLFCQKEKGMNNGNNTKSSSQKRYI